MGDRRGRMASTFGALGRHARGVTGIAGTCRTLHLGALVWAHGFAGLAHSWTTPLYLIDMIGFTGTH